MQVLKPECQKFKKDYASEGADLSQSQCTQEWGKFIQKELSKIAG